MGAGDWGRHDPPAPPSPEAAPEAPPEAPQPLAILALALHLEVMLSRLEVLRGREGEVRIAALIQPKF